MADGMRAVPLQEWRDDGPFETPVSYTSWPLAWTSDMWWRVGAFFGGVLLLTLFAAIAAAVLAGVYGSHAEREMDEFERHMIDCKPLRNKMLPLVVSDDGVCYFLAEDINYEGPADDIFGVTRAIEWTGARGELRGAGRTWHVLSDNHRQIVVDGASPLLTETAITAELLVTDFVMVSPTQRYGIYSRGVQANNGATLRVVNSRFENLGRAIQGLGVTLQWDNVQITGAPDAASEDRAYWFSFCPEEVFGPVCQSLIVLYGGPFWGADGVGIACLGDSFCTGTNTRIAFNETNAGAGPIAVQTTGLAIDRDPFQDANPVKTKAAGGPVFSQSSADITATAGVVAFRSARTELVDTALHVVPAVGDINNVANGLIESGGMHYACCNPSNLVLRNVAIEVEAPNPDFRIYGAQLTTADYVDIDGLTIVGSLGQTGFEYATNDTGFNNCFFNCVPRRPQLGLLTINTFSQGRPINSASVRNLITTTYDQSTYHVVVDTDVVNPDTPIAPEWARRGNASVHIDGWTATGGAAGLLIGSGARKIVTVKNADLDTMYYGIHAHNESSNFALTDNDFSNMCHGVFQSAGSTNGIIGDNGFMSVVDPLTYYDAITYSNHEIGTGGGCGPAPFLYDAGDYPQYNYVAVSSTSDVELLSQLSTEAQAVIAEKLVSTAAALNCLL